jgi:hypothetical protein
MNLYSVSLVFFEIKGDKWEISHTHASVKANSEAEAFGKYYDWCIDNDKVKVKKLVSKSVYKHEAENT